MICKSGAVYLIALLGLFPARALQAENLMWTVRTDWEKAVLRFTIEAPVPRSGPNLPAANLAAERGIEGALTRIFTEAVFPLLVDSRRTVGDAAEEEPELIPELLRIAAQGKKGLSQRSRDLGRLSVEYSYPFYGLLSDIFVRHRTPREIPRHIAWQPTREFTGIVIHAGGELPLHGEARPARLEPCLFPEIFDEAMNPVLLTDMGDPEYLKRWGSAAYTADFDEGPWRERIGGNPLRIVAQGLFGKHPTDIKIFAEDAARILSNPKNRRLLAEGRILIIADLK